LFLPAVFISFIFDIHFLIVFPPLPLLFNGDQFGDHFSAQTKTGTSISAKFLFLFT